MCRCYKNVFYLVTLVYPRCAQTCLQLFSVTKLDVGSFLSADFTITVRDTAGHWGKVYVRYLAPGIALMLLFAIGLPIWYFYIMWTVRARLKVSNPGNTSSSIKLQAIAPTLTSKTQRASCSDLLLAWPKAAPASPR